MSEPTRGPVTGPVTGPGTGEEAATAAGGGRLSRRAVEGSLWSAGALLVLVLVGFVNYLGMKYYQRWDWTGSKLYSLSEKTGAVLAGLDRDIRATIFLQPGSALHDPARELLERYAAKSSRFTVRSVDPERNLVEAQRLAEEYQLTSSEVIVFEAGDDRRVVEASALADYDYSGMQMGAAPTMTAFKGEEAFTGAVLELVEQRKPKVLLTTGHGERSLEGFDDAGLSRISELLGKENLTLESWSSLGQPEVPAGTDLLVVAGPKVGFLAPELEAFSRYLARGGRMLVMVDPELDEKGGVAKTGLEAWLAEHGVALGDDLVVDPASTLPFFGAETIFVHATGFHPIVQSLEQAEYPVIFGLARSVQPGSVPADYVATVLLQTTDEGWGERDLANLRGVEKGESDTPGPVAVGLAVAARAAEEAPAELGELEEELAAEATAEGGAPAAEAAAEKEAPGWRLVVFGDSDFATNAQLANVGNPTLLANAFNWLLEREKLLGIGPKKPEQVRLSLAPGQVTAIWVGTMLGLPALAVAGGVAVWWRRRR